MQHKNFALKTWPVFFRTAFIITVCCSLVFICQSRGSVKSLATDWLVAGQQQRVCQVFVRVQAKWTRSSRSYCVVWTIIAVTVLG